MKRFDNGKPFSIANNSITQSSLRSPPILTLSKPPEQYWQFQHFFWSNWALKIDFSCKPIRMPIIAFRGLEMVKKGVSIAFLLLAVTNSGSCNFFFLAFLEAKMTKIDILNQKLIVSNDYQQFWVQFEWF